MLTANLPAIAKQILQESKYKPEVAIPQMIKRIESDSALRGAIIHEAVSSLIRAAASQQRTTLTRQARVGVDNTRGLTIIEGTGYLDTYVLLNRIRLGDAKDEDLAEAIANAYSLETAQKSKRKFLEAIRKSPKFKAGKRVRDCFSDLELKRMAGEFKC